MGRSGAGGYPSFPLAFWHQAVTEGAVGFTPFLLRKIPLKIYLKLCFWAKNVVVGGGTRVFRFTSKSEFRLYVWGAHADRYDRATDQKNS